MVKKVIIKKAKSTLAALIAKVRKEAKRSGAVIKSTKEIKALSPADRRKLAKRLDRLAKQSGDALPPVKVLKEPRPHIAKKRRPSERYVPEHVQNDIDEWNDLTKGAKRAERLKISQGKKSKFEEALIEMDRRGKGAPSITMRSVEKGRIRTGRSREAPLISHVAREGGARGRLTTEQEAYFAKGKRRMASFESHAEQEALRARAKDRGVSVSEQRLDEAYTPAPPRKKPTNGRKKPRGKPSKK
jgi:predicted kinase